MTVSLPLLASQVSGSFDFVQRPASGHRQPLQLFASLLGQNTANTLPQDGESRPTPMDADPRASLDLTFSNASRLPGAKAQPESGNTPPEERTHQTWLEFDLSPTTHRHDFHFTQVLKSAPHQPARVNDWPLSFNTPQGWQGAMEGGDREAPEPRHHHVPFDPIAPTPGPVRIGERLTQMDARPEPSLVPTRHHALNAKTQQLLVEAEAFELTGPIGHARALVGGQERAQLMAGSKAVGPGVSQAETRARTAALQVTDASMFGYASPLADAAVSLAPTGSNALRVLQPGRLDTPGDTPTRTHETSPRTRPAASARQASGMSSSEGSAKAQAQRLTALLMNASFRTSAVQISVTASETGFVVMARVERMGATERARLQSGIANLLAEHGLKASDIILRSSNDPRNLR